MQLYPLLLEPIYKEKVWGGRSLERLGRTLPGGATTLIGESWEVADLASTAVSGGGGGAARSVVRNGPLAGSTLTALVRDERLALLGEATPTLEEGFPLLVKYLDARQNLSVQVHPSAEYAARHPGAHLKSEAWYVVDAEPGAVIYKGVHPGTVRADMERAIREGTVGDLMIAVPAVAGESHYLPSGTCHALGAGTVVAEVQTPSDTTFRLYDWGREGRELHVEAALTCMDFGPVDAGWEPGFPHESDGRTTRILVECGHFGITEWREGEGTVRDVAVGRPEVWMVLHGSVELRSGADSFGPVRAVTGHTIVLPASLGTTVAAMGSRSVVLRITLPDGSGRG